MRSLRWGGEWRAFSPSSTNDLTALFRELLCQSHCHGAHVRPCTLRSLTVALSRFIEISPSVNEDAFAFCIRISPSHEFMGFLALHRNIAVRQRPIFRRRYHAPLSLVAIRACSSPCAALRRSARLSRGCSSSRPELSRSSLIFTPREYKRIRAPHRRYSDCYTKCQSRRAEFLRPGVPG